jgi:hypothetical protein
MVPDVAETTVASSVVSVSRSPVAEPSDVQVADTIPAVDVREVSAYAPSFVLSIHTCPSCVRDFRIVLAKCRAFIVTGNNESFGL